MSASAGALAGIRPVAGVVRDLVSLTKPRVTLLVVITALGGVVLAPERPSWLAVALFLAATSAIVGSANALNCWIERDSDRFMERTRDRPLPSGRLAPGLALAFGLFLGAVSVPALAIATNALTAALGAVALVSYVAIYTPLKRKSPVALYVGAIPGAIPPLMGASAATGAIDAAGLSLFAILFLWQVPHFLAIALYRESEYARAGLRALPVVSGARVARVHSFVAAVLFVAATLTPYVVGVAGDAYLALAIALGAWFLTLAARGLRKDADAAWARRFFFASLLHLALLVASLAIDVAIHR